MSFLTKFFLYTQDSETEEFVGITAKKILVYTHNGETQWFVEI